MQNFHYDGQGPQAQFFAGYNDRPSNDGFQVPNEKGSVAGLNRYSGDNIVLSLPSGKTLKNLRWLSVWCEEFEVNFGEVLIPERFQYPRPQKISSFNGIHEVTSGRVVVVDAQTFLIPRFSYDGQAPDAHFWVGKGNRPGPEGRKCSKNDGNSQKILELLLLIFAFVNKIHYIEFEFSRQNSRKCKTLICQKCQFEFSR